MNLLCTEMFRPPTEKEAAALMEAVRGVVGAALADASEIAPDALPEAGTDWHAARCRYGWTLEEINAVHRHLRASRDAAQAAAAGVPSPPEPETVKTKSKKGKDGKTVVVERTVLPEDPHVEARSAAAAGVDAVTAVLVSWNVLRAG